jgi:hypothetical protein
MGTQAAKFECLACGYSEYRMSALKVGELLINECPKCRGDMAITAEGLPPELEEVETMVGERFGVLDFVFAGNRAEFEVSGDEIKSSFSKLLSSLKRKGYLAAIRKQEGELRLSVVKRPKLKKGGAGINVLLLLATIATTWFVGRYQFGWSPLSASLFSGSLLLILGTHELGHKIAAWRNGVDTTLPYFIPFPFLLGTFGAVIKIKSPIPNKDALAEMGAFGPLAGFFAAIPITLLGLSLSQPNAGGIQLGLMPGIFVLFQFLIFGGVPAGLSLSPLAFTGWVMMIITMFNLMPAGQLDGGHVARSLLDREKHLSFSRNLGFLLILIGFLLMLFPEVYPLPLWLWGFLILFFFARDYHPGALNDVSPISKKRKVLAAVTIAVFLLCFPLPQAIFM